MPEWLTAYWPEGWGTWQVVGVGLAIMVTSFTVSILAATIVLVRLPADYFTNEDRPKWPQNHLLRTGWVILRNLLGAALVVIGVILSLPGVPGQGVLTMFIGVLVMDFPGKQRLLRWILSRRGVLPAINKVRGKFDKEPLKLPS